MGKTTFDISLFRKIEAERKRAREAFRRHRLAEVKSALKSYFAGKPVERVYLFGSILTENHFRKFSDIDVAVEGLDSKDYLTVFGELEELLGTEQIDLVRLEKCHFADLIEKYGELLVSKNPP